MPNINPWFARGDVECTQTCNNTHSASMSCEPKTQDDNFSAKQFPLNYSLAPVMLDVEKATGEVTQCLLVRSCFHPDTSFNECKFLHSNFEQHISIRKKILCTKKIRMKIGFLQHLPRLSTKFSSHLRSSSFFESSKHFVSLQKHFTYFGNILSLLLWLHIMPCQYRWCLAVSLSHSISLTRQVRSLHPRKKHTDIILHNSSGYRYTSRFVDIHNPDNIILCTLCLREKSVSTFFSCASPQLDMLFINESLRKNEMNNF